MLLYICPPYIDTESDMMGGDLMKTEFDETIGARFVRLNTQSDGFLPAEKFRVVYGAIPGHVNVVWCSLFRHY